MNSKERLLSRKDTWISLVLFALMFFSMYFPYNHALAIGYQVLALVIGLVLCRDNSWGIAIIVILNATREYIAVSTTDKFTMYYSLNGIILLIFIIILAAIKIYEKNWLVEFQPASVILLLFGLQLLLSQVWASNKEEYTSYFPVICALYIIGCLALENRSAKKNRSTHFHFCWIFYGGWYYSFLFA